MGPLGPGGDSTLIMTVSGVVHRRINALSGRWTRAGEPLARDDGSALIEFAISLPLLAFISMAAMAVMAIVQAQFGIQAAAREGANVGANVSSSINTYDRALEAAKIEAERVMVEYGLDPANASLTFEGNDPDLLRGTYFQIRIDYEVTLATPTIRSFSAVVGGDTSTFTVDATSVVPIQLHKARWPCPSPDPICG